MLQHGVSASTDHSLLTVDVGPGVAAVHTSTNTSSTSVCTSTSPLLGPLTA
jgi:hypothetical protein